MAKTQTPDIELQTMNQTSFGGGINTGVPPTEIGNEQIVDVLNMELTTNDTLRVRQGVTGVGNGAKWDVAHWDQDLWSVSTYAKRITSIHYFQNDLGLVGILYTSGTKLYSRPVTEAVTDLTGALNLPDDTFWQWVTFNGIAIGVNKSAAADNPIKVSGTAPGVAAALGGTPPKGKYIEVWNNRVWIVDAANPNTLRGSKVGDPEDWTTVGAAGTVTFDINKNDGDQITAIKSFKGKLIIYKRRKIYQLWSTAETVNAPNTDPSYYRIDEYTKNSIGCIAANTVQNVLDDQLFLSESGIASLSAAAIVADFRTSLLSRNVADISDVDKNVEEISSVIVEDTMQYWISIPKAASAVDKDIVYVMDYRRVQDGLVRWVTFDGYPAGTVFATYTSDTKNVLVGCQDRELGVYFIGFYIPRIAIKTFRDGANGYTKSLMTKEFHFGEPGIRKLFQEWGMRLATLSEVVAITINYFYNGNESPDGAYNFNFTMVTGGSQFDNGDLFDNGEQFDSGGPSKVQKRLRKTFKHNSSGRKAASVALKLFNAQIDQGFEINNFSVLYAFLNSQFIATDN